MKKQPVSETPVESNQGEVDNAELMVLPTEEQEPRGVSTRGSSAWRMGVYLGMVYDCSDETAIQGLIDQVGARRRQ